MGFIAKDDNKIDLVAYLTQEARNNILNGEKEDFQIEYYSLCDPDTNYYASGANNATLPTGFIADLTGDHSGVIKSMAAGTLIQKNFIKGANSSVGIPGTDGNIGSEKVKVGFTSIGGAGFTTSGGLGAAPTITDTSTNNTTKSYRIPVNISTLNTNNVATSYSTIKDNIKYLITVESVNILASNTQTSLVKNFYKQLLNDSIFFYDSLNKNKSKSIVVDCKKEIDTINITRDLIISFQDFIYSSMYGVDTKGLYGMPSGIAGSVQNSIPDGYSITISVKPLSFIDTTNVNGNISKEFTIPSNRIFISNQSFLTTTSRPTLSNDYKIPVVDNSSIIVPKYSNNLALKKIEKNGDGTLGFEKTITRNVFGVDPPAIFFSKADINDKTNPKLNLFSTFNLPSSNEEFANLRNKYKNTGLYPLFFDSSGNTNNKILIGSLSNYDYPNNIYYGELIDGKTFQFGFKYYVSETESLVTSQIFGSYFYTGGDLPNFNTLYSDPNKFSTQFSNVEPNITNDFNSNIAYLFCNDISKPKISSSYVKTLIYSSNTLTLNQNGSTVSLPLINITYQDLNINDKLIVTINSINIGTSLGIINFSDNVSIIDANDRNISRMVSDNYGQQVPNGQNAISITNNDTPKTFYLLVKNNSTINLNQVVRDLELTSTSNLTLSIKIERLTVDNSLNTTNLWDQWTVSNKFSKDKNNNNGKMWATFSGTSYDEPVGIVYLDKGFFIITNQYLVNKFYIHNSYYTGFADDTSKTQNAEQSVDPDNVYTTNDNYTFIYDEYSSNNLTYSHITSEFTQNIYCLSLGDEHTISSNPTFNSAYQDTLPSNKKIVATEIGLYNKFGKLVALAKTSEPIIKNPGDINVFQITLKL